MIAADAVITSPMEIRSGVLVLSGYGLHIGVERGQLCITDGIGRDRRSGTFSKATSDLKRLVVLGHSGTITLDAMRWLHDIGAALVQIDPDGIVIVANGPSGLDDARLRRAQALAAENGVGIAIARDLLVTKLTGQAELLARFPVTASAVEVIEQASAALATAKTPAQLRVFESRAAAAYWSAWAPVAIRFAKRDQDKLPDHWTTFGTRTSPITGTTRAAGNPINALLNYLYGMLETEVRLAILTIGLDPGMGMLHSDRKGRDSFLFDVIEPLRPLVDGHLLTMLEERSFAAKEFFETRQGVCRLMPPLPQTLAQMTSRLATLVAPVVEQVAQRLAQNPGAATRPFAVATLLTRSNQSASKDPVRTAPKRDLPAIKLNALVACLECGEILEDRTRQYCDTCLKDYREEQTATFTANGRAKLQRLRAIGIDPSQSEQATEKRRTIIIQRRREELDWNAAHPDDVFSEATFTREILPHLQGLSLTVISAHTGLSQQYCSLIRRGLYIPHPRHWENFTRIETPEH